jgi:hypothetical protein
MLAAFAATGLSRAGLLLAVAVAAAFLAHEPAAILLGLRGSRARRERRMRAGTWLAGWLAVAGGAVAGTLLTAAPVVRWSLLVPLVPSAVLVFLTATGREKSWAGEVSASLAFSTVALPIALSGGGTIARATELTMPFALLFVSSTLAVRGVILGVRGGGDPSAAAATRRATILLAAIGITGLGAAVAAGLLGAAALVAALPGLSTAALLALRPPPAAALRRVGWTLVAVSVATAVLVILLG